MNPHEERHWREHCAVLNDRIATLEAEVAALRAELAPKNQQKLIMVPLDSCQKCPAFGSNSEYPETVCAFARRTWGMGYYEAGAPTPDWCPLREGGIAVMLEGARAG